ncbi:flagellar biosynthetic protein FliO [Sporolactobacillus shoreicorticis]|uniref:Flagellar biosynthetic protein FliO n=1 Tax=Sporolactobacillus shoreicorticis TaxID=1923877 RepID=A0ABW5S917_9BACL|nr:flagellar biosynthetic protein FliO [Sporolactobacillus shoreicorticis]MCO7125985.1 flagellar biosynthetic protein FliO [Sporolactobacillus shoreicorticis]
MKKSHWFKVIIALFILIFFCVGHSSVSYADSENGTVKDWIENGQKAQKTSPNSSDTQKTKSVTGTSTNLFVTFIKLFFALLIVLALIYLLYHFVAKRSGRFAQVAALKNMGGVSLGTNRSLQLVRVGDEILVVGVGETVQLLKEIKDPEVIEALTQKSDAPDPFEENVMKALKWTTDHALRRSTARKREQEKPPMTGNQLFHQQLILANKERSKKLSALIREVVKK